MLGDLQKYLRRKRRILGIAFAATALLFAFIFFYEPASPDGIYFDPGLACGHGCWIFKGGKISITCDGEAPHGDGAYFKSGNKWVIGDNSTNITFIKPSLFGLKVTSSQLLQGHTFWPRDCFSWVIDCKEWMQEHIFNEH